MTKTELLDWMVDNYPEFPTSKLNCIKAPTLDWAYMGMDGFMTVVNVHTGYFVSSEDFYAHRARYRLKSCDMSFQELLEDLKN